MFSLYHLWGNVCAALCWVLFFTQTPASAQVASNPSEETSLNSLQCFTNYTLVAECADIVYDESDLLLTTFTYADGAIYEGYINTNDEFINKDTHVLSGRGTIFFKSGATYQGYFLNSERHGWGTHTYVDGSKYIGCWQRDLKHGKGGYTYGPQHTNANNIGAQYVGEWVKGDKHGHGEYFSTQWQYCGGFEAGMFQGIGQWLRHRDEAFFEGGFLHNVFSGHGRMTYGNGNTYVGEWWEGEKHGLGTFYDASNAVTYSGGWKHDVMHGKGKMVFAADGFEMPGEWREGSLVRERR